LSLKEKEEGSKNTESTMTKIHEAKHNRLAFKQFPVRKFVGIMLRKQKRGPFRPKKFTQTRSCFTSSLAIMRPERLERGGPC
jgi:hypothetical protein